MPEVAGICNLVLLVEFAFLFCGQGIDTGFN